MRGSTACSTCHGLTPDVSPARAGDHGRLDAHTQAASILAYDEAQAYAKATVDTACWRFIVDFAEQPNHINHEEEMREELDDLLCQRYPRIFADRHRPVTESSMAWGFEVGDGWFDLIDALCEQLQFSTDYNKAPQLRAAQVKEKFGTLSFYWRGEASQAQRGMIALAGTMSARICEKCGRPGRKLVHDHIHMTRCPDHIGVAP